MSSSMPIPKRKLSVVAAAAAAAAAAGSPTNSTSSWSSTSSSMSSPGTPKGKGRATETPTSSPMSSSEAGSFLQARRPSLLGSSLSKSEYTVVNLAHSDGPPRLVTCVKSSQGFDWNQELFLPSYAEYDSQELEHRPDPVEEIYLTDEEAKAIMPQ